VVFLRCNTKTLAHIIISMADCSSSLLLPPNVSRGWNE
jgi:hypothetical protein